MANAAAARGRAGRRFRAVQTAVAEAIGDCDWIEPDSAVATMDAGRIAGEEGAVLVAAAGGDGTVHWLVNGLMQAPADRRPTLAVLPAGSGNDFAFNTGLPFDLAQAAGAMKKGRTTAIDVIRAEAPGRPPRWFINSMGIHLTARIAAAGARSGSYWPGIIRGVLRPPPALPLSLQSTGPTLSQEVSAFVVCNGAREGGGFHMAPGAANDDGQLDYLYADAGGPFLVARLLVDVLRGRHLRSPAVHSGRARSLRLRLGADAAMHFDGEIVPASECVRDWTLSVEPGAIRVVF